MKLKWAETAVAILAARHSQIIESGQKGGMWVELVTGTSPTKRDSGDNSGNPPGRVKHRHIYVYYVYGVKQGVLTWMLTSSARDHRSRHDSAEVCAGDHFISVN